MAVAIGALQIAVVALALLGVATVLILRRWLDRQDRERHLLRTQVRNLCRVLLVRYREQKRALADQRVRLDTLSGVAQAHGELGETVRLLAGDVAALRDYAEHQAQLVRTLYDVLTPAGSEGRQQAAELGGLGQGLAGDDLPVLPRSVTEFGAPSADYSLEEPEVVVALDRPGEKCAGHIWREQTVRSVDGILGSERGRVEAIDVCPRCAASRRRRIK